MKEIRVDIVISGEVTDDQVNDAIINLCESNGWLMSGIVEDINNIALADAKKILEIINPPPPIIKMSGNL